MVAQHTCNNPYRDVGEPDLLHMKLHSICCEVAQICYLEFRDFSILVLNHFFVTNLFVDADVEEDKKDEGDDTVDEHVEINKIYFDI